MIHVFTTRVGTHTFRDYLGDWAGTLAANINVHCYEDFLDWPSFPPGTFIFSDLERLNPIQLEIVRQFRDQLVAHCPDCRILNDPRKALRRLDLLNTLYRAGINRFNAYPVDRIPATCRFPVFLRGARDHIGPRTPLLDNQEELNLALGSMLVAGMRPDDAILVEFIDTRDGSGNYWKYSVFRFGEETLPAHVVVSKNWIAKDSEAFDETEHQANKEYIALDPHREQVRRIFDLAGITYGRIDYSMFGNRIQVWEINTNPILLKARAEYEKVAPEWIPDKEILATRIGRCLREIDSAGPRPGAISWRPVMRIPWPLGGS